jgi:hypothetical protein
MNWNSKTKNWTDLKSLRVRNMALIARRLKDRQMSIMDIAFVLDKSESRIREYLRTK